MTHGVGGGGGKVALKGMKLSRTARCLQACRLGPAMGVSNPRAVCMPVG